MIYYNIIHHTHTNQFKYFIYAYMHFVVEQFAP